MSDFNHNQNQKNITYPCHSALVNQQHSDFLHSVILCSVSPRHFIMKLCGIFFSIMFYSWPQSILIIYGLVQFSNMFFKSQNFAVQKGAISITCELIRNQSISGTISDLHQNKIGRGCIWMRKFLSNFLALLPPTHTEKLLNFIGNLKLLKDICVLALRNNCRKRTPDSLILVCFKETVLVRSKE